MSKKYSTTTADYLEWSDAIRLVRNLYDDKEYVLSLLIACGVFFGLRISDLLTLTWEQVLNCDVVELVEMKTGKKRTIKINPQLQKHIKACKELKNNNIDDSVCAKLRNIPQDVWEYMYRTMNGRLWDDFVSLLIDEGTIQAIGYQEARNQMKKVLFRKVFYTYAKNVKKDNEYGKAFKELYPNIMKIIRHYKRTFHAQCVEAGEVKKKMVNGEERGKDKIQLPHILMRLESAIFTDILTRLFKKRDLHCIGIHDAIAVMNDRYTPEYVQNIMMQAYKQYGLIPTLDVQNYGCSNV